MRKQVEYKWHLHSNTGWNFHPFALNVEKSEADKESGNITRACWGKWGECRSLQSKPGAVLLSAAGVISQTSQSPLIHCQVRAICQSWLETPAGHCTRCSFMQVDHSWQVESLRAAVAQSTGRWLCCRCRRLAACVFRKGCRTRSIWGRNLLAANPTAAPSGNILNGHF